MIPDPTLRCYLGRDEAGSVTRRTVDFFRKRERPWVVLAPMKKDKMDESLAYDSLNTIARNFEEILKALDRLRQLDWFRRRSPIKTLELAVRETYAWTLFEILEVLRERAESEWTNYGRMRSREEGKESRTKSLSPK